MGNSTSLLSQTFPPKTKFRVNDIPDLAGKVIIVTGGSAGIGKDTAKALLQHNAKVYIASYNARKAGEAISDLQRETGKEAIFLKLDLADLNSIKASAEEFLSKESDLHVLFNNAGVYWPAIESVTEQGYDRQFGVHVLGHFYFTQLLLPALIAGAKSSPDGKARIVNTSSSAADLVKGIDFNTLKDGPARRKTHMVNLYAQSKLGNILISNELARIYGDRGIVSIALNPGNIRTEVLRNTPSIRRFIIHTFFQYDISYGPLTQLYAGTAPEAAKLNGKYLIPWARVGVSSKAGQDSQLAKELWTWLEEQIAAHM